MLAAARNVQAWAFQHHETLETQPIGLTAEPSFPQMQSLRGPPEEAPTPFDEIFQEFRSNVEPWAYRTNHPRFLAFVPGAPSVPSMIGDWLTAAANFFAGVWLEGSGPAQVESTVLDWFRTWLGMPEGTSGVLTAGGSEANLIALVVAREQISFADRDRAIIYVAEQRHWSIDRAAKVMGIRRDRVRVVPVDDQFRLRGDVLQACIEPDRKAGFLPWAVVANAGATNTGTVDALDEIADVCNRESLWLHIDGAYGWAAVLTEDGKRELSGIERADSVTLDPHKWLAQTFDVGCVLVRNGKLLPETFATRPDYLQDVTPREDEINYADYGIALTRRFRALKIWLSVRMLGLDWFRQLVQHSCDLAQYAQAKLEQTEHFEILCPRRLSILCFRHMSPKSADVEAENIRLLEKLRETGRVFLSSTRLNGVFAIRMCFVNWRTTAADVDEIVELLVKLAENTREH